jgi:hypothetical protein
VPLAICSANKEDVPWRFRWIGWHCHVAPFAKWVFQVQWTPHILAHVVGLKRIARTVHVFTVGPTSGHNQAMLPASRQAWHNLVGWKSVTSKVCQLPGIAGRLASTVADVLKMLCLD